MEDLKNVVKQFNTIGEIVSIEKIGAGHINVTYLVTTDSEYGSFCYVIQRVNTTIFKDIEGLMNNVIQVTEFIRQKVRSRKEDAGRATLNFMKTLDGKAYYTDEAGFAYRCYLYIGNVASIQVSTEPHQLYLAGVGFGRFYRNLDGFPASKLVETIPNFHNTLSRYNDFCRAVDCDKVGRKASCEKEIAFFLDRAKYASIVVDGIAKGDIPLRVTHNDTKLNNVLIDFYENEPVAVIDLDTVMPGSILYDFGDTIRSGANIGAEDEVDLTKVGFSLEMFDAFSKGFVSEVKSTLTEKEKELLPFSGILLTYECGMRFLEDYLKGDTYFRNSRPNHNLDRARTQIKMISDMEKAYDSMVNVIKKYC